MSFEPTLELRDRIYESAAGAKSFDQADQGLLNGLLWPEVHILPPEYSLLRHFSFFSGAELKRDQVRSIHYINKKPWELWYRGSADAALSELDDVWTRELSHEELLALVSLSGVAANPSPSEPASRRAPLREARAGKRTGDGVASADGST